MSSIPTGEITFLFTDIEGSTKLSQKHPGLLQVSLEKHNKILKETIESNNGHIFEIVGDAYCAAFERTIDSINAAIEIQKRLLRQDWNKARIKVRIGIHRGNADWKGNKYIGYFTLAKVSRIMSVAHGGQILSTSETLEDISEADYDSIEKKDLGKRQLKDIVRPDHIFQLHSEDLKSDFPPLKTLDRRIDNLPVQLTSFVGREEEIRKLKEILEDSHLLTLKGPGGSGKTRLAIKTAGELIDEFPDGVRFIDLTSIRDETLLPRSLSSVMSIDEAPERDKLESIIAFLRSKEMLIVLDNCEHLISACSEMTEKLLLSCPGLKILATSREALNCQGEIVFNVMSLKLPGAGNSNGHEKLIQYEAVRLFIDRAIAADPKFEVNNDSCILAGICQQLEGIPLAIELAAAKIKMLSLEKIYNRLDDRFRFLTGGKRTAYPRQQTLKSMVDWSYDLLSEKEKILFRKLSIFSDGWTIDAAEKVCDYEYIGAEEILDLLGNLCDKSLVNYVKETDRYRMLETIREYGDEKLFEAGELEPVILKHLDYFTGLAEEGQYKLTGKDQIVWKKILESENQNFHLALTSSITRDKRLKGIRLAIALGRLWEIGGKISTGRKWFEEFMDTPEEIPLTEKAKALQWLGTFEWIAGNYDKAQSYYELSFEFYNKSDNIKGVAVTLNNLGLVANARHDYETSLKYSEESYRLIKELGDKGLTADALMNLATVIVNKKEYDKAGSAFDKCLNIYREIKDFRGEAMTLSNLGNLKSLQREYESARGYLEESLKIQREIGDTRILPVTLRTLGSVMGYLGMEDSAEIYLQESISLNRDLGDKMELSSSLNFLGFLKYELGELENSLDLHLEGLKLQIESGDEKGMAYSIIGLAESVSREEPENSATFTGAVSRLLRSDTVELENEIQKRHDKLVNYLQERLGEETYLKNFRKGEDILIEDAVKLIK